MMLILALGLGAGARGEDYDWSGACGVYWHQVCSGSLCDEDENRYWQYNNWGGQACGVAPMLPGPADAAHILSGNALIYHEDAWIGALEIGPERTLSIDAPLNTHRYLYLEGPTHVNNGTLRIHTPDGTGLSHLYARHDLTLSGEGAVVLERYHSNELANLDSAADATLTNGADHTIQGRGHVRAALSNDGRVLADVNTSVLHLLGQDKQNAGTMEARAGGLLYLDGFTLTQSPTGRLLADGGTISLRGGATIVGGEIDAANGGAMQVWVSGDGSNTFRDTRIAAEGNVYVDATLNGHSRLQLAGTTLVNDGVIRVGPNYPPGQCSVEAVENVTISGSGAIILERWHSNELSNLRTAGGAVLTQAAGHTLRGWGHVRAALVNEGLVSAEVNTGVLQLFDRDKHNAGTMEARSGGLLYLEDFTLTQSPTGRLLADGGTVSLRGGAKVAGGHVATANSGAMQIYYRYDGSNTFEDVTVDAGADVYVDAGLNADSRLYLTGTGLVNNGVIRVGPNYPPGRCTVEALDDVTLSGVGVLSLERYHSNQLSNLKTADGAVITHAAEHTIRGLGHVNAAIVNEGTIAVETSGHTLEVLPKTPGITHAGRLIVAEGATMKLMDAALFAQTGGETDVAGTLQVSGAPLNLQSGALRGKGTISGSLSCIGGAVEPGDGTGTLTISGAYTQGGGGLLRIELGGTQQGVEHDWLKVTGAAALGGELEVVLINGFAPEAEQEFIILTAGSVNGRFDRITGAGKHRVRYESNRVVLTCKRIQRGQGDHVEPATVDQAPPP
ncbi:MAG: hypothetical protein IT449_13990 [Phycisphaerales bacterium]|nr:hypothetical protein [Phycisphaerales bacterium]